MKKKKDQKIIDGHIFNRILFKDKNKPVDFEKKSQNALTAVERIKKGLEQIGTRELTFNQKVQIIKTKEKEEFFLSKLDYLERKKFKVKKKLFELISPYDEEDKRLEEVMAMAHVKTLPGIFRLARHKSKLFENIKSSNRHIPSNKDKESPSHLNNNINNEIKSNIFNKETQNNSKILNISCYRQNAFLNTPRKPTHTISSASSFKNKYFNNSNMNSLGTTTTFKNNFKSKIENVTNEINDNNEYYIRDTNRVRGTITNNQTPNQQGLPNSNYTTENVFFGKSKPKLNQNQIEQNLSKLKEARGQVKKLIHAMENQTFRSSFIIPKDISIEMKLRKSMSNFNSTSHSKFLSSFV